MEDFTGDAVRSQSFPATLRGYDRGAVEAYLDELGSFIDALQRQLAHRPAEDADYAAIGQEVARVLEEARIAADSMRSRAAAETAAWRNAAEQDAVEARQAAWLTGTEMLDQVIAECQAMLAGATQAAARLRSETEQEILRQRAHAQREREELTKAGREEAERTLTTARREADSVLMSARHEVGVAQERTAALEKRRAELTEEVETAQRALLGIEDQQIEVVETQEPSDELAPRSHWPEDDGAVRIVTPRPIVREEPVDADALAAEVEAMRGSDSPPVGGKEMIPSASMPSVPPAKAEEEDASEAEEEPADPGSEEREEIQVEAPEPEDPEPEPEEPKPDPLVGLFDKLRHKGSPPPDLDEKPAAAPASVAIAVEEPAKAGVDAFALRDRLLLPAQNRALREVKRQLVAAQNRALEELRLDDTWEPGDDLVDGELAGALHSLGEESTAAGIAAAGELLGRSDPPQPEVEVKDAGPGFLHAFVDAVTLSLQRSRSAGAGKRETASALSKVFRAWRTDDAERRVRHLSHAAYHNGALAGFAAMDCDRVRVIPSGRSCIDCDDDSPPWLIADGPPPGTLIPPASLECSCTVVPDC